MWCTLGGGGGGTLQNNIGKTTETGVESTVIVWLSLGAGVIFEPLKVLEVILPLLDYREYFTVT